MQKWTLRLLLTSAALVLVVSVYFFPSPGALAAPDDASDTPPAAPAVRVEVAAVQTLDVASVLWVPGTVVARNDVRLAAEISGLLTWVADVGDTVAAGDVVAKIDDRRGKLQIEHDEATIRRLEVQVKYLNVELERLRTLADEQIAARRQLDEILARQEMAEQDLVLARVTRKLTLDRLDRTEVRSPFPGKVVKRYQQAGGYVSTGGEIVRLVDTIHTEVSVQAPVAIARFLKDGMNVRLRGDEGEIDSRIRAAIPVGDERSRMFEVRVELPPGKKNPWVVGAAVRCGLPQNAGGSVVVVPRDALILRHGETYVLKVSGDSTAERVVVATGVAEGELIEVRGDVAAGDRVVVRGGERLEPGQAVSVQGED